MLEARKGRTRRRNNNTCCSHRAQEKGKDTKTATLQVACFSCARRPTKKEPGCTCKLASFSLCTRPIPMPIPTLIPMVLGWVLASALGPPCTRDISSHCCPYPRWIWPANHGYGHSSKLQKRTLQERFKASPLPGHMDLDHILAQA